MNNQEIFDKVWTWFIVERHGPGVLPGNIKDCRYFVDPQTKCAIGCLLSDEIAARLGPAGLIEIQIKFFPGIEVSFLSTLRGAHDVAVRWGNFYDELERRLRELAATYGLQTPDEQAVEELICSTEEVTA